MRTGHHTRAVFERKVIVKQADNPGMKGEKNIRAVQNFEYC